MTDQAHRHVALLRGIAPSGHNMSNVQLRGVLQGLGFAEVGSVLASGNVTFRAPDADADALEARIEAALSAELGLSSRALVRSLPQLLALLDADPFVGLEHTPSTYLTATFVRGPLPAGALDAHADPTTHLLGHHAGAGATLAVTDNDERGAAQRYMAWLERSFGKAITTRSWLTVGRIAAKLAG